MLLVVSFGGLVAVIVKINGISCLLSREKRPRSPGCAARSWYEVRKEGKTLSTGPSRQVAIDRAKLALSRMPEGSLPGDEDDTSTSMEE